MANNVIGLNNVLNNLVRLRGEIGRKALRAVYKSLAIAALKSAQYTPIATSTLLNSQRKEYYLKGSIARGTLSYHTNYAEKVNDPKYKQRFRRKGAKKRFLQKGFLDSYEQIRQTVINELKS